MLGLEVAMGMGWIGQEYRKLIRRHRTSIRTPAVAFAIHLSSKALWKTTPGNRARRELVYADMS